MKTRNVMGVAAALCTAAGALAQPANDTCGSAIALTLGTPVTENNATATSTGDGPAATCQASSNKGIWYTFTPAASGNFTISACGSTQDTVLQVFTTDCTTFTAVACDDDSCAGAETGLCSGSGNGLASVINSVALTGGVTYHIRVSSYGSAPAGGCVTLGVSAFVGGACCSSSGSCSVTSAGSCSGTSSFQGPDTTCTPNPCTAQLRVCCSSSGTCSLTMPAGCAGATQTFLSGSTACTPTNPCTALLGSCCNNTSQACSNTTSNGCSSGTSTFNGAGTACGATPLCPGTGACCSGTGVCTVVLPASCAATSAFQGAGSTCLPSNPCPALVGACCSASLTCTVTFSPMGAPAGCTAAGSTFQGLGTTCSANPCGGACCTTGASPTCTLTTVAGCLNVFKGLGSSCSPLPCPSTSSPANDECPNAIAISNASLPATADGNNAAASTDPSPAVCVSSYRDLWYTFMPTISQNYSVRTCGGTTGTLDTVLSVHSACPTFAANNLLLPAPNCNDDGCSGVGPSQIPSIALTAGVNYWIRAARYGTGSAGGPITVTIDEITGTCCNATTGACTITSQVGCGTGTWTVGGTCTATTCPGACCNTDGSCVANAATTGCANSGVFQGTGTVCGSVSCPIPNGACCDASGVCSIQDGPNCPAPNTFVGNATTCSPDPCAALIGACCASVGTCSSSIASGCSGGSTFQGAGTSCSPNPCPQPPSNDLCDSAQSASLGDNPGTCVAANGDGAANCGSTGGRDVFFKFTPAATGNYRVKTCNSATAWDTVVSVHSACPATSANTVACDDDGDVDNNCTGGVGLSRINTVALTGGTQYVIRVAGYSSATTPDAFVMTIELLNPTGACCVAECCSVTEQAACTGTWGPANSTCSPNPCPANANDNCANAIAISNASLPVTVLGNNCNATDDGPAAICGSGGTASSVWWSFSPTHTAAYTINNCGSAFDSILTVFSGDCVTPVEIGCNDDFCGLQSQVSGLVLTAGQTYLIRVGSYGIGGGAISVTVSADGTLGSCCATDGSCSLTDTANCTGAFTAGGSCTPNICPQPTGACCCGAACIITLPAACTGANQVFSGSGTSCTPYSATVPCCRGNYNKSAPGPGAPGGVSVQDIFDFLAAYFTNDPCANANDSVGPNNGVSVQDIFDFLAAYFGGCP
ncbi:MAG: hypothetical protein IT438_05990 [Phycisphaerales bacterium]|nr:hypothetical protein [Phycisphaerales bacterium]